MSAWLGDGWVREFWVSGWPFFVRAVSVYRPRWRSSGSTASFGGNLGASAGVRTPAALAELELFVNACSKGPCFSTRLSPFNSTLYVVLVYRYNTRARTSASWYHNSVPGIIYESQ